MTIGNLFMYSSQKTKGIFCFAANAEAQGLPKVLSPWSAVGVLRSDQTPPHGMSRDEIETGVRENGYQLWRKRLPVAAKTSVG